MLYVIFYVRGFPLTNAEQRPRMMGLLAMSPSAFQGYRAFKEK